MNRDGAVALMKQRLARFTGSVLDAYVIGELQAAQIRLEEAEFLPWFLRLSEQLSVNKGDRLIDLPTGFLLEIDGELPYCTRVSDGAARYLEKKDIRFLRARTNPSVEAAPRYYMLRTSKIDFGSPADAAYTLDMEYYTQDSLLTSGTSTNLWLRHAPDYLIAEAGIVLAGNYLKNDRAAQYFMSQVVQERQKLIKKTTARDDINVDYVRN